MTNENDNWRKYLIACPHCGHKDTYGSFVEWDSITREDGQVERNEVYYDWRRRGIPTEFKCPKCFGLIIYDVHLKKKAGLLSGFLAVVILLGGWFLFCLYLAFLGEQLRDDLGKSYGNILTGVIFVFFVSTYLILQTWKKGKRHLTSVAVSFFCCAFLAFIGWWLHPMQVYERSLERLVESKVSVLHFHDLRVEFESRGMSQADIQAFYNAMLNELKVRELEHNSASLKYGGSFSWYKTTFYSWSFWGLSLICAISGFYLLFRRKRKPVIELDLDSYRPGLLSI